MGDSLKLFGKDFSRTLIETTTNPYIGLFIGILSTSVLQSSSSTTSIVVAMVAGGALTIDTAIPIIMGANIGTSITNTIASLPQINRSNEFKRAFAAATVHDFFNFLTVLILFPLQILTNFLGEASYLLESMFENVGGLEFLSPVKLITEPVAELFISFIGGYPWLLFIISLLFLFTALKYIVSSLKSLVISKAKNWFDRVLFKTAVRAFLVGILLTILVQSSSITTSLIVPMAGAGILTLRQIFPYTIGSNLGTTITAMLAALITGSVPAVVVAFAHLLFNIFGTVIWWPLKFIPIFIAERFAEASVKSKLIPVAYVVITFFIIPFLIIYFSK